MSKNAYSINKIQHHPELLAKMKCGEIVPPVIMHLMPENRCNHDCSFCCYRLSQGKNLFRTVTMPKETMIELIKDFKELGGKSVEITGGGEPLVYPFKHELFDEIFKHNLEYALVTNGTLLDEGLAQKIVPNMTWARISIDAGTPETYAKIRKVKENQFLKALNAVSLLRKYGKHKEFRIGVGFVVNNENFEEIYTACKLAKEYGAHNIRLSAVFHPDSYKYFTEETIKVGTDLSKKSEELTDDTFTVYNLFSERINNTILARQDYKFCGTKEFLFVAGADCNLYTCCTLAYRKKGLIGSLRGRSLKEIWNSEAKEIMFKHFDARKTCTLPCLYEKRNKLIIEMLFNNPLHVNFL